MGLMEFFLLACAITDLMLVAFFSFFLFRFSGLLYYCVCFSSCIYTGGLFDYLDIHSRSGLVAIRIEY